MTHHSGTLAGLVSRIQSVNPWGSFPTTSYLDAQAILLWMRLGVFDEAISLLQKPNEYVPRWQIEAVVKDEVLHRATTSGWFTATEVEARLDHPNIYLNPPAPKGSAHDRQTAFLRRQIADEELIRNTNAPQEQRRHLGEADTITVISRVDPGSVFVTGDVGAFEVARRTAGVVPIRGLAFVAAVVANGSVSFEELWRRICYTRICLEKQRTACHSQLSCPRLSVATALPGVLSERFANGGFLAGEMASDFEELLAGVIR